MLSYFVFLIRTLKIAFGVFAEIVVVDEFIAGVIRRVDVNHLHLVKVSFLKQFERIQIIARDKQVLRGIKIYASLSAGAQCLGYRCVGGQ